MRHNLRVVLALLFVHGCRCAELDPGLIFQCGPNGECDDGLTCAGGYCVSLDGGEPDGGFDAGCVPTRSCAVEECGVVGDDGCGADLDCGACSEPFSCGLLVKNRCGCVPFTSADQVCPKADAGVGLCGDVTVNNCGTFQKFTCGPSSCATGFECSENLCCLPPAEAQLCATAGFHCGHGRSVDPCGTMRELDCGLCPGAGQTCVVTDQGSECVNAVCTGPQNDMEFCDSHGVNCGTFSGMDSCGVLRSVKCGEACDAGGCTSTQPNQCTCQGVLAGCRDPQQCCAGLTCGTANLCCVAPADPCTDDADCCGTSWCSQGLCCVPEGTACTRGQECCSGVCGADGGCEYVDAGSTWDGGEL